MSELKIEKSRSKKKSPAKTLTCLRCNPIHHWTPRKENGRPERCPRCSSPFWNKPPKEPKVCLQCDYIWVDKTYNGKPIRCPDCGSRDWNNSIKMSVSVEPPTKK